MNKNQWFANLPNLISVGRLVFVPVPIALTLNRRWSEVFLLFALAGLSDAVDGFIAKHFELRSEIGGYLDPLPDKALLVSIFVARTAAGVMPAWLAIVVVSRDVMIVGAVLVTLLVVRPVAIRTAPDLQGEHHGADRLRRASSACAPSTWSRAWASWSPCGWSRH